MTVGDLKHIEILTRYSMQSNGGFTMADNEIAIKARETAQGIINTLLETRANGGNTDLEIILIRTFETLSNVHKKAVGKGLIIREDWIIQEEATE